MNPSNPVVRHVDSTADLPSIKPTEKDIMVDVNLNTDLKHIVRKAEDDEFERSSLSNPFENNLSNHLLNLSNKNLNQSNITLVQ